VAEVQPIKFKSRKITMFRMTDRSKNWRISSVLLALVMLSACNTSVDVPINTPVVVPTDPVVIEAPTQAPVEEPTQSAPSVSVDISSVAQGITSQVVAAVPASADHPWWEVMPEYTLLTLQGYSIADHLLDAQIFVYPVEGLGVNEVVGQTPGNLQALLQSQQVGESMPYLPAYNAGQVIHAQVAFLDFKNGKGVRYLTQFDQAPLPINNYELHYTFQGLTSDGKYYVAAVLPVNLADLPSDASVDLNNPPANLMEDFPTYLSDTVNMLNGQPSSAYRPDLSALDAMVESLEIK
jgi:hypothetical protein